MRAVFDNALQCFGVRGRRQLEFSVWTQPDAAATHDGQSDAGWNRVVSPAATA
jgi:hypothetical protein